MIDAQLSRYGILASQVPAVSPAAKIHFVGPSASAWYGDFLATYGPDADGGSRVFASIATAVANANVVASRGDVILVLPGHTETVSAAGGIALNKAGVTIIGLGAGTLRPTVTLDTATTATISVSAANVTIENIVFSANFADIVSVFTLTTAANFTLRKCAVQATATNMNFLYVVDTDATTDNASGLTIEDSTWIEPDTATLSMVKMDGDNSRVVIQRNFLSLGVNNNKASIMAIITNKSVFHSQIVDNFVYRLNTDTATGGILVTTDQSDNSGVIARNFVQHADTAAEILVTASSGFAFFENRASGVAGATGYVLPAADS